MSWSTKMALRGALMLFAGFLLGWLLVQLAACKPEGEPPVPPPMSQGRCFATAYLQNSVQTQICQWQDTPWTCSWDGYRNWNCTMITAGQPAEKGAR